MSQSPSHSGPLHLKSYLDDCTRHLKAAIRDSVSHPVSFIRSIACTCTPGQLAKLLEEEHQSLDPAKQQAAHERREKLANHRNKRISRGSSTRLITLSKEARRPSENKRACHIFAVEVNEEEGVVRGFCRRCQKMFVVFDRHLFWGLRRDHHQPPESFPYRCLCGGHSFEIGVGFDYADECLDENDFQTVTIAVRCCACESISMVLDEEG